MCQTLYEGWGYSGGQKQTWALSSLGDEEMGMDDVWLGTGTMTNNS